MAILSFMTLSCSGKKEVIQPIDYEKVPVQVLDSMYAVEYERSSVRMEMGSPKMERFSFIKDSAEYSYELFSDGFSVKAYTEDGLLETQITSEGARHITKTGEEEWIAFGDVNIVNYIRGQKMLTDTIYWNRDDGKIFTDCYVKLISQEGMMQGYGMESDELARNAKILNPFDSYGQVGQDSTKYYLDTANFVGPMQRF